VACSSDCDCGSGSVSPSARGLQVQGQVETRRLHHRQIGRLRAAQDAVHLRRRGADQLGAVRPARHQETFAHRGRADALQPWAHRAQQRDRSGLQVTLPVDDAADLATRLRERAHEIGPQRRRRGHAGRAGAEQAQQRRAAVRARNGQRRQRRQAPQQLASSHPRLPRVLQCLTVN
jgi:hypothetical protein